MEISFENGAMTIVIEPHLYHLYYVLSSILLMAAVQWTVIAGSALCIKVSATKAILFFVCLIAGYREERKHGGGRGIISIVRNTEN